MSVEIRRHTPGSNVKPFIEAGKAIFADDPSWVAPLDMELRERLTPKTNPFFERGEAMLFTAWRDGQVVGRCSASVDREHLRVHKDDTGFFGFFDTIDDDEVGRALVTEAAQWLRDKGMKRMRGPMSLYINEEVGVLVDGFEHPPSLMMAHSRAHQGRVAEACGLTKEMDLYAWKFETHKGIPQRAERAWQQVQEMPEVRFRSVDKSKMHSELEVLMEIFNDAWGDNWGFVPATEPEVKKSAKDLKLIIDENLAFFAEVDGRPMGICVCLPNLNEAIRDLDGKLLPFGLLKMLWRLKVKHPASARLMMLGIRKELRGVKRYGALSTAMYVEVAKRGAKHGYNTGELSWTLENNRLINIAIRAMGAEQYKTYRVYEKQLKA